MYQTELTDFQGTDGPGQESDHADSGSDRGRAVARPPAVSVLDGRRCQTGAERSWPPGPKPAHVRRST
jgi:hypothetical protein